MEPHVNLPQNMNLPPIVEQNQNDSPITKPEQAARPETASPAAIPAPPAPAPTDFQLPSFTPALQNPQSGTLNTTDSATPAVADDNDLIEKEWVQKAKQIVEKNRENPYEQSRAITSLKADYMQKRYNKTVKLSE